MGKSSAMWAGGIGLLAGIGLVGGSCYQELMQRRDREWSHPPGELVEVNGHLLHLRTEGMREHGPTVVFENGMTCPSQEWEWIAPRIAEHTGTLRYDRPGNGFSDPTPHPRTADRMVAELETAIELSGAPGPYILVGHSFGGLLVRHFAHRNPGRTAGVVLVDATHPEELERSPRQQRGLPWLEQTMYTWWAKARLGLLRHSRMDSPLDELPSTAATAVRERMSTPGAWRAALRELHAWRDSIQHETRGLPLPGGCALSVVTAGKQISNDPVHGQLQRDLAELSEESSHTVVDDADHYTLVSSPEHAERVVRVIELMARDSRVGSIDGPPERTTTTAERSDP
ncbi:Pimeloyl-ACP methyl ester carboxylesterase [Actinopolyspora alba]|uniref:Pimeloyl-ACP methyl ester carboxylesterase n=1 Tax=Actinopolyspora alba TaxID=673379 RepID=A0A1I2C6G8_9ACTN|nr:alpha/beta hydrolase [Actinopolyspora alba]SFE63453.1 Pimeloyl-ACP methyl ester carboxylesterase [Actinopolyspora alba]